MTAQQLKNSILQMAMQGKLVPQNPNDEPASVLLERIRAEKEQMIKDGKIKKEKNPSIIFRGDDNLPYEKVGDNEPVCIADEVPFEIPDSWEWVRLGNLFYIEMGQSPKGDSVSAEGNGIEFHQGKVFFGPKYLLKSNQSTNCPTKLAPPNSVLLCVRAPVGKVNITEREICIGRGLCSITPLSGVPTDFVYYLLETYEEIFIKQATGTTFAAITGDVVKNQLVPLPPLAEQKRIIEKIDEVVSSLDQYNCAETKIEDLNRLFPDKLKKSILQQAVQGKLVPQDPADEPASILLERIRAEKEQMIKDGKIKRDKHESAIYRKDGSFYEKVDGVERCIDDEIPFEIPESWEWARLGVICTKLVDGDHNPPKGESSKTPYIMASSTNINNDTLVELSKVRYLSEPVFIKENERTQVKEGDIFFTSVGSLGRSCIYAGGQNICFQRSVSVITTLIYNYYLKYYFDCAYVQQKIVAEATGTAQKGFYLNQLEKLLVPIPPLNEQQLIIKKIKEMLRVIEKL